MPLSTQRSFGLFIFGDEILSGKRQDRHFDQVRSILAARGLALSWVMVLGDDRARAVRALRESFASGDVVFSCGGIGSTPDDHTRQAAAQALGLPLELHPQAEALIRARAAETGQPASPERLRMGEFPSGSGIIPNPYNRIPGFFLRDHYFVPGFPVMAWPMIEWVLDNRFRDCFRSAAETDMSMIVLDLYEAAVTPLMQALCERYPDYRFYSLPSAGEDGRPRHVELGVKASGAETDEAAAATLARVFAEFRQGVIDLGGVITEERTTQR
jgi:molybdopterin-biosynthesis enzyme MoeA-like protein